MNGGVENTLYKERQRDLEFFVLENRKLKGMLLLSSTTQHNGTEKTEARLLSKARSGVRREAREQGKF